MDKSKFDKLEKRCQLYKEHLRLKAMAQDSWNKYIGTSLACYKEEAVLYEQLAGIAIDELTKV